MVFQTDPQELASQAHLRYSSDTTPGFMRIKKGKNFKYYDILGKLIDDIKIINRIDALGIPPAWENVWISPYAFGHIQATGRDEKGRKQYIYHTKWNEITKQNKFNKMLPFSEMLPEVRIKIESDMEIPRLTQERILATIVWLLDNTYIRVGNEEYARDNKHYGLTTMRNKHVSVQGTNVVFEFTGKSGKKHQVGISHSRIAKTIRKLEELPGYELFQYIDDLGHPHPVDSQDVNDYLKSLVKEEVTAKDFRTWGGTVLSAVELKVLGEYLNKTDLKKKMSDAIKHVSKHLGNTPTVCRNYYVHPTVLKTYEEKVLIPHFENHTKNSKKKRGLSKDEYATAALLRKYNGI